MHNTSHTSSRKCNINTKALSLQQSTIKFIEFYKIYSGSELIQKLDGTRATRRALWRAPWSSQLRVECRARWTCHSTRKTRAYPLHTKSFIGKTWATNAQQDLPDKVAINSRLLVSKAYRVSSISKHKPALQVSYFSSFQFILTTSCNLY
jgi:hypothetical protein